MIATKNTSEHFEYLVFKPNPKKWFALSSRKGPDGEGGSAIYSENPRVPPLEASFAPSAFLSLKPMRHQNQLQPETVSGTCYTSHA